MSVKNYIESLGSLDPDNIGSWPGSVKAMLWGVTLGACAFLVYYLLLSDTLVQLETEQRKETELMATYSAKAFEVANLDEYRKQMKEMEITFSALKRQLPADTEVPGLLEDISQRGFSAGLQFDSIALGVEQPKGFYVELPIEITVRGNYHALGTFVSGVASLPRIVTLHDFDIKANDSSDDLTMSILAKTYRYSDDES